MSFWRKLQIKIRNRWNDFEFRENFKKIFLIILILFLWLLYNIIKRTAETNSYDKILPWLKILGFSTFVVLKYIFLISIIPGFLLYKLNKIMYHEKSIIAWIPIANIYLLGKLTINDFFGKLLIIGLFVFLNWNIKIILYCLVIIALYIYAIGKYIKLKKKY